MGCNAYAAGGGAVIDEANYQLLYKIVGEERNPYALELLDACDRGGLFERVGD